MTFLNRRPNDRPALPRFATSALIVTAPLLLMTVRLNAAATFVAALLQTTSLLLGAAVAEELFFRGYAQSRLNEAFARPYRVLGTDFGPGLFIASALFGLVHGLNTYNYFQCAGRFNYCHALVTASALFHGLLRERTGTIVAPIIVHALIDVGAQVPR